MKKTISAFLCAAMLCTATVLPASAEQPDYSKEIEAISKWLDGLTLTPRSGTTAPGNPPSSVPVAGAKSSLTENEMQAYAIKVFEIVNEDREKAGLFTVVWDNEFAACAQIRAGELQYLYSHTRPVQPQNNAKRWPGNTNGIGVYNAPSVADEQGISHAWIMENIVVQRETPEAVMDAWMNSVGHKRNILKESHVRCGAGVYYTSEETPTDFQWF